MTRRNFFRSALACFGAMVLAPVRAVCGPEEIRWTTRVFPWGRIHSGQWRGRTIAYSVISEGQLCFFLSAVSDPMDWDYTPDGIRQDRGTIVLDSPPV